MVSAGTPRKRKVSKELTSKGKKENSLVTEIPAGYHELLEKFRKARKNGLLPVARQMLEALMKATPGSAELKRELIMLHIAAEDFERSSKLLEVEVHSNPSNHWAWIMLGMSYSRLANPVGEIRALSKAMELKPEEAAARRLFEIQRDAHDFKGALDTVRLLRKLDDKVELAIAECKLLARVQMFEECIELCESLMKKKPVPPGVVEQWAAIYLTEKNEPQTVINIIKPMVEGSRDEAAFKAVLGRAYHRLDYNDKSVDFLQQALASEPKNRQWWYELAVIQRQMGDIPTSQLSFSKAMEIDRLDPTMLRVFGAEHTHTLEDQNFLRINHAVALMENYSKQQQVELHYAAAKAFEDVGQLDIAFSHYFVGGRKQTQITPYKHTASTGLMKTLRIGMRPATYSSFKHDGSDTDKSVFVFGMPRSGTSLVEQIISSHPNAFGAGELKLLHRVLDGISVNGNRIQTSSDQGNIPTYIPGVDLNCSKLGFKERGDRYSEAITAVALAAGRGDVLKIVDKMPGNYFWAGLIPFIMPKSKIVHTRRHPADICISNYRIFFPDGMPWSYDLRNLGKCYRAYHEHMLYWESNLPDGVMLSVNYEKVVDDLENMSRQIIDHIGLEWDANCLKFYENERAVKTASLGQVRKPIYSSSVGRWRKYEKYLKPLLTELGPLIEDYEKELDIYFSNKKDGVSAI